MISREEIGNFTHPINLSRMNITLYTISGAAFLFCIVGFFIFGKRTCNRANCVLMYLLILGLNVSFTTVYGFILFNHIYYKGECIEVGNIIFNYPFTKIPD